MNRIEKFRHLFPPLRQIFPSSCGHQSFDQEIKKCRKAYLSSISALYPGRDLNPHARDEHRILSPACLPIPPPGRSGCEKNPLQRVSILERKTGFGPATPTLARSCSTS